MRLLNLPAILRSAGLTVHEVPGWRTRGDSDFGPLRGITCHHTAGSRSSTDAGEIRTLIHGSSSAPPPIAQLYLSRSGAWHVVASGTCWHNLQGWGGPNRGLGNYQLIGIEAQHSGAGEPWTEVQYWSYVRGVAALCRGLGVPVDRVAGHKEHQPGSKNDPSFDMNGFRADVRKALTEGDDDVSEKDVTTALYKAGPYASKGVGAALKKEGWADTSLRAISEYTLAATRALTAAAKVQDAKLDVILARLTDAADVEAKVDALAQAEAQRAEADRLRDELVLAAVTADDTVPPADVPGGGTTRPGQ